MYNLWTNLPPWPYTFCTGTKLTRNRHEKTQKDTKSTRKDMKSPVSTWEFFLDSSFLYFHTGMKYLVPAQAIIIDFRTNLVSSQVVLYHVSCRPGLSWTGTDQPEVYHTFNLFLCRHEIDTKSPVSTWVMRTWKMTRKSVATVENYFTNILQNKNGLELSLEIWSQSVSWL